MDIRKIVGARIRELRLKMKISQEALANIAEIDRTYMTSVENGKRNISIINLEKIVKALETDFTTFFKDSSFYE
ncbi:MAG: helix-turn-helix transcriptional regulator [Bacteroidales bacterium]|nr:helix-turn-helix transcriptional regulator [Bacteroidales bacterium]